MSNNASRLVRILALLLVVVMGRHAMGQDNGSLQLALQSQRETSPSSGRYHTIRTAAQWNPKETALIVCDVWDLHHSQNAVRRATEFCGRLDKLLAFARERGITVIHSPSDCMDAYAAHPARKRAIAVPRPPALPQDIAEWCSRIPAEERAAYPIDQSDGGDDDDPVEHAAWAKRLVALGRNPGTPWKSQTDLLTIDGERDYVSDRGDEVWSILRHRGIKNVILTGVHTNMCVLGRPFGLRQMARNGMNVVLVRDLTDTMYNPQRWPYVSHFAGTDLVISHIERHVCPTVSSDQFLGGESFRFAKDARPHLAIVMAEDEYKTDESLTRMARGWLNDFRITLVYADAKERNRIVNLQAVSDADVVLLSVRRRTLSPKQLDLIRKHVGQGKPMVGIRTSSHAFCLRNKPAPDGMADWPEFDAEVWGGSYTNHHGNQERSRVTLASRSHSITKALGLLPKGGVVQHGSLYMAAPLAEDAQVLLEGRIPGKPVEPVAWTYRRQDGGKSFYTSIGHRLDLANPFYQNLLTSGLRWAAGLPMKTDASEPARQPLVDRWTPLRVPSRVTSTSLGQSQGWLWQRCAVRLPQRWVQASGVVLDLAGNAPKEAAVWVNGHPVERNPSGFLLRREWLDLDDANLIVVRTPGNRPLEAAPVVRSKDMAIPLAGHWQLRVGAKDAEWSNIPLPARYGASTDMLFEPAEEAQGAQKSREFEFTYAVRITDLPKRKLAKIWIPVPSSDSHQSIRTVDRKAPAHSRLTKDAIGNTMQYSEAAAGSDGQISLQLTCRVTRRETLLPDASKSQSLAADQRKRHLAANAKVPIAGRPVELLPSKLLTGATLEVARQLYDRVDEHVAYDKSKPGYGNGDVLWVCDSRTGNCTDFHSLFIALARSQAIPARFEIGFPLPEDRGEGSVGGYHCWASFFDDERGWVSVDISEADKHPEKKAYFFGNLTENRIAFTRGRDLTLNPQQAAPPLNYFIYPHVEVDGKMWPAEKIETTFSYRDVGEKP